MNKTGAVYNYDSFFLYLFLSSKMFLEQNATAGLLFVFFIIFSSCFIIIIFTLEHVDGTLNREVRVKRVVFLVVVNLRTLAIMLHTVFVSRVEELDKLI